MVSRKQRITAIIVVAAVVVAGLVYVVTRPAQETPSRAMILMAIEIGPGWTGSEGLDWHAYPGETSESIWWYSSQNGTGTFTIEIDLTTFNTTRACHAAYEGWNSSFYANRNQINYTTVPIGDRAIYVESNKQSLEGMGYPEYVLMRGNVLCVTSVYPNLGPFPWYKSILLNIVGLQLEKIDRYLIN
jgi:hypothetical protein